MRKTKKVGDSFDFVNRATGETNHGFIEDGRLWVYDDIAVHFTTCHSVPDKQIAALIAADG